MASGLMLSEGAGPPRLSSPVGVLRHSQFFCSSCRFEIFDSGRARFANAALCLRCLCRAQVQRLEPLVASLKAQNEELGVKIQRQETARAEVSRRRAYCDVEAHLLAAGLVLSAAPQAAASCAVQCGDT